MKLQIKSILLCTGLMMSLNACSPRQTDLNAVTKANTKADAAATKAGRERISISSMMSADGLVAAGEKLMTAHTLNYANHAFELALKKDPQNMKAALYLAFLKRFMVFRGLYTRLAPMAQKYGYAADLAEKLNKIPKTSPLHDFFTRSAPNTPVFQTEEDIQNLLNQYKTALQDFRTFVTAHQDLDLQLSMNSLMFGDQSMEKDDSQCKVFPKASQADATVECTKSVSSTVKVNIADLMVLKQEAAGEILLLSLVNSYSLKGAAQVAKDISTQKLSASQVAQMIESRVDLKLSKTQSLTDIRALGSDMSVAAKWAVKYHDSLCPSTNTQYPRQGYLVKEGVCTDQDKLSADVALVDQALAGLAPVNWSIESEDGQTHEYSANVNILAPLDKPAQDLRSLGVKTWNAQGTSPTALRDNTLGGLFPEGNADSFLPANAPKQ